MDTRLWSQKSFTENYLPDWRCPSCQNGILKLVPELFHFEETIESKKIQKAPFWDPSYLHYSFIGYLECIVCHQRVSFCGDGNVDEVEEYDEAEDINVPRTMQIFTPQFFSPPLLIIAIPPKCPDKIKKEIHKSFCVFWVDPSSCANRIRVVVELIMDNYKVKKYAIIKHRRTKLSLHKRIEIFTVKKPDIGGFLLSTKWICNEGSHPGDLERDDVLLAYHWLEDSLYQLYDDKVGLMKKISEEINKRRGKRKRKSEVTHQINII